MVAIAQACPPPSVASRGLGTAAAGSTGAFATPMEDTMGDTAGQSNEGIVEGVKGKLKEAAGR